MYTFDPINKYILIPAGTLNIAMLDVYNDCMDWVASDEGMAWELPMYALGKISLTPGVYTDIIYVLQNGWKLKFTGTPESYQARVVGTVVTDDGSPRTVQPDDGWVEVTFNVSTSASIVETGGESSNPWDSVIIGHTEPGTFGEHISKKVLTLKKFMGLK